MEIRKIFYSFYVLFLLVLTVFIGIKPYYGSDMLFYMAIVLKMDGETSVEQVHHRVYAEVKQRLKPNDYQSVVAANDYREKLAVDTAAFGELIPFYTIKPLYLVLAFLFYKLGASLLFATVLPGLLSFFAIGLLLLRWIDQLLPLPWLTVWSCVAILTSEPLVALGKSIAPDGLSTMLVLIGAFFFIEKQSLWRSTSFFVFAILTRPDSIILIAFFFLIAGIGKWTRSAPRKQLFLGALLCLGAYCGPHLFLESFSWSTLFYHAFVDRLLYPLSTPASLSVSDYYTVLANNAVHSTYAARTSLLVIALFTGVACRNRGLFFRWKAWTFNQTLAVVLVVVIVLRFLLFPAFLSRFIAPFLVISGIIFIKEIYQMCTVDKCAPIT